MRKKMLITTEAVLIAGIAAAFLRLVEVKTIFEPETGLAKEAATISIILIALTIAVCIKAVLYSASLVKKGHVNVDMAKPFPITSKIAAAVITASGIIIAVGSIANFFLDTEEATVFKALFLLLGIVAGVSIIVMVQSRNRNPGAWACMPAIFMCYWLVLTYKENNTNPVLLEYCYECLAAASATVSFYYAAGHYYGKLTPKRTIISHLSGVYFCLLTTCNAGNPAQGIMYATLAVYQLVMVCAYIKGSSQVDE